DDTNAADLRLEVATPEGGLGYGFAATRRETAPAVTAGAPADGEPPASSASEWRGVWELDGDEPPTDTAVQRIVAATPEPATVTMEREGWNRVYAIDGANGRRWDAIVLDEDRQVIGLLSQVWMALQLRGMGRRSATNLRQAADRAALMSYA